MNNYSSFYVNPRPTEKNVSAECSITVHYRLFLLIIGAAEFIRIALRQVTGHARPMLLLLLHMHQICSQTKFLLQSCALQSAAADYTLITVLQRPE